MSEPEASSPVVPPPSTPPIQADVGQDALSTGEPPSTSHESANKTIGGGLETLFISPNLENATVEGDEDVNSVWANQFSTTTHQPRLTSDVLSPQLTLTNSTSGGSGDVNSSYNPSYAVHAPYLDDLDPYAPNYSINMVNKPTPPRLNLSQTLGSTVAPSSRLELLPDSDSPEASPTFPLGRIDNLSTTTPTTITDASPANNIGTVRPAVANSALQAPLPLPPLLRKSPPATPTKVNLSTAQSLSNVQDTPKPLQPPTQHPGSTSFLGGMLRSISGNAGQVAAHKMAASSVAEPATTSDTVVAGSSSSSSSVQSELRTTPNQTPRSRKMPTPAEQEKAQLGAEYNEKSPVIQTTSSTLPSQSVGSAATISLSTPISSTSAATSSSPFPNPFTSIKSAFRSVSSSRTASQAGDGTPPLSGSSPTTEKGSHMEVGNKSRSHDSKVNESPSRLGKEKESLNPKKGKESIEREEVVFDFNKFLEQMRSRSADPIAKYLRSFLKEFSRRPPAYTADQVRVISDFLDFIAGKMRNVEPWRSMMMDQDQERGEAEFDMAMEAMEKLVMNRLWHLTFTPALDLSTTATGDVERDHVLSQRIRLFAWVKPEHLDLPSDAFESPLASPVVTSQSVFEAEKMLSQDSDTTLDSSLPVPDETGKMEKGEDLVKNKAKQKQKRQAQGFLDFAKRELIKINQYKAPRDKLICILNSCKVIFGLMRHISSDESADSFIPFLIYVVLKANPEHLVSNIMYIQRFRNPEMLSGEGGYYLSSLSGAISFIETMDASALSNCTQEEFEKSVEEAIQNLPLDPEDSTLRLPATPQRSTFSKTVTPEPAHSIPPDLVTGTDAESPTVIQQPGESFPETTKAFLLRSTDSVERIVSKPLNAIGRIFEQFEHLAGDEGGNNRSRPMPQGSHGGLSPSPQESQFGISPMGPAPVRGPYHHRSQRPGSINYDTTNARPRRPSSVRSLPPAPDPAMYAPERMSAGEVSEQIDRQQEEQRLATLETLKSIFPDLESEVLEMVLLSNSGDMARTIDSLLEMS